MEFDKHTCVYFLKLVSCVIRWDLERV